MSFVPALRTRVSLALSRPVDSSLEGVHTSIQIGRSHEFHDLRSYVPGDNVRDIDWRASARSGDTLVKRYTAQRQTTLLLIVATGRDFAGLASPTRSKREIAVEAAGVLGIIATSHGDRVGMLWSQSGEIHAQRPRSSFLDLERLLSTVNRCCSPADEPANLPLLLERATALTRRRCVVVVLADDLEIDAELEARLRRLGAQHDVWLFSVLDAAPDATAEALVGLDTGKAIPQQLRLDRKIVAQWHAAQQSRCETRKGTLHRLGIRSCDLSADPDVVGQVLSAVGRWRRGRTSN